MKKNYALKGTLALGVIAGIVGGWAVLGGNAPQYSSRSAEVSEPIADKAFEDYKMRRLNPSTGQYDPDFLIQMRQDFENWLKNNPGDRAAQYHWIEEGPDNVGGRTRAILLERNNLAYVFAGSVSGGLFMSVNGGNTWGRVTSFDENLAVSAICQTLNGRIYVGTGYNGFFNEGFTGNGLYYSDDLGATWTRETAVAGNVAILELQADPVVADKIWLSGSSTIGLRSYDPVNGLASAVPAGLGSGNVLDHKISPDGQVHVACVNTGGMRTYVSTDAGANFTNVSGTASNQITSSLHQRIEYSISQEKNSNGQWTIFASGTNSHITGTFVSEDNGQTWSQIAPAGNASSSFNPFATGLGSGQGYYDNVISAVKGSNGTQALIGGIDVYGWTKAQGISPTFGQWEQRSLWFVSPISPIYVHADNHEMEWDAQGTLYIGNDGGIGKSPDGGNVWFPANRGYNVTQFYSIAFSADGDVMGGAQDNGTQINRHNGTTLLSFDEVRGGDGFDCDISHINEDVMFASVYTGDMQRSDDGGVTFSPFITPPSNAPFRTVGRLYENPNDLNSTETIGVILNSNYSVGDTIFYESKTFQEGLIHICTQPYNNGDTVDLQDYVQSIYAIGYSGTGGVIITRDALRFSADIDGDTLFTKIIPNVSGQVNAIEFSADGDHMYVGTSGGVLYRVSGLNTWYAPEYDASGLTVTTIHSGGGSIEGIGVDPADENHVVLALGTTTSSRVLESNTAATVSSTGSFVSRAGNLPSIPCYDVIVDRNNPNIFVLGTEFGVYVTDNGGSTWTYQTDGPGKVPVYAVRQQWRDWNDGAKNPGVIYLGTFGRGIWRTEALLSVKPNSARPQNVDLAISIYPNPMVDNGVVGFELSDRADVVLKVFNMRGQLVKIERLGSRGAGKHQTNINVADLSNGTYFVSVEAGNKRQQGKLLITR